MTAGPSPRYARATPVVLAAILLMALVLRWQLAGTEAYVHDETATSIPLSKTISFTPGQMHLPLRGQNHGALPAYVVKVSSTLFGTTPLAYRGVHVLLSLLTIVLVYRFARQRYGPQAGLWAASLLALNEYYLAVSARATAHVPHLFFVTAAVLSFCQFLSMQRAVYLYAAGAFTGLAFYCKEHSALLLPLFLVSLLHPAYRPWLRRPHVWLAAGVFVLVIGPDLAWNLKTDPDTARVSYGTEEVGQATYANHLKRVGGVGLSPYPAMFYGRSAVQALHVLVTRRELTDQTPEYPSMNPVLGVLLLGALVITALRYDGRDRVGAFLLLFFWGMFGVFTFIEKGNPPGRLDPVSWIWVEATIIPAVILAGARLAGLTGTSRLVAATVCVGALLYAAAPPALAVAERGLRAAQEVSDSGNHAVQVLAIGTVDRVRERPLRAVALAAGAGLALGVVGGFCVGWWLRSRKPEAGSRIREPEAGSRKPSSP